MRAEEVAAEAAGMIGRLQHRLLVDPAYGRALVLDNEDNSAELVLAGIEDAIVGLVMLHIQVRRR